MMVPEAKRDPGKESGEAPVKNKPPCQICGKPSKNVFFATYLCDSDECINKARDYRGGPGGHKKNLKKWLEE
jgi:hypothetical protein